MGNAEAGCKEVLEKLYLYLDHEVAGVTCADIERHLAKCRDCFERVSFERELKDVVGRKCRETALPPDIVERLRARIRELLG